MLRSHDDRFPNLVIQGGIGQQIPHIGAEVTQLLDRSRVMN
jgi:hypothetical protein